MNNGILVVVSAPSGCGKDTVVAEVLKRMPDKCFLSVSMTTRAMREGEAEGVDYFFVTRDEFHKHIEDGDMLEYAVYGDNMYGTPIGPVRDMLDNGKIIASGTHKELMKKSKEYHELYKMEEKRRSKRDCRKMRVYGLCVFFKKIQSISRKRFPEGII